MRAAMQASAFQRLMHRLALAATFALLLVPALGRMAQAAHVEPARDAWGAMCTDGSLDLDPALAHAGHHGPAAPEAPPHHGAGDCDYCPLLQGLVSPVPPVFMPVARVATPNATSGDAVEHPRFRHPNGLGSRGPPRIS
jgi:hypothetical protein